MLEYIRKLFDADFMPHGHCYYWQPEILWPIVIGDALTVISYFIIPLILIRYVQKRSDLKFNFVFKAFAAFILFCGVGHLIEIVNIWEPVYRLSATVKMGTGLVSAGTVAVLMKIFPQALKIPSPLLLSEKNKALEKSNLELQQANEDLNEMMTKARMGIWEVDLVEQKVIWSPMIYQIHEVPEGTTIDLEQGINYYHPDFRDTIREAVRKCAEEGEPWDLELKLLTAKQNTLWVRAIGRAIYEEGKVVKLKGLFQDINESKLRQEQVEESELLLKEAQRIGKFGNWSWDMVKNDLKWSDELYEIFGQKPQSFGANYEALMSIIHPQDREMFNLDVEDSIANKRAHDLIHRIVWPKGEIRYVHERGQVYYDESGKPVRMAGTTQDVTDRLKAQQELIESETALKEAEKIAKVGNWKWYVDEGIHEWSDQRYRILEYEPQEVQPSIDRALEVIDKEDRDEVMSKITKAMSANEDYELVYHINTHNDKHKVVKEKARWLNTKEPFDKQIYIGTVQDITRDYKNRKQLEESLEALKRSNHELKNFAYVASHDLQEPLRVIASYLQIIDHEYKQHLDEEGRQFIENTVNASVRMKKLINDLLALSRLETGEMKVQQVDTKELLNEALADLQVSIQESKAEIKIGELPNVNGDPVQLKQLFLNLIANAIKFRKKDETPTINVSARQVKGRIKFSITDNGIGMDPEYFDRIFHIFQRLHTRQEYEGTGIGLAFCKKIVEQHGGVINVTSDPGKGSTFTFDLKA